MYNNTYLAGMVFNVGNYIRLSQEDKDKKYESIYSSTKLKLLLIE